MIEGKTTSYFRGRKLYARKLQLPSSYKGVVVSSTDRILPPSSSQQQQQTRSTQDIDGEEVEGEEESQDEVKILEEQAEFEDVMVWGHEAIVDASEDCYVRGVKEWIDFAESVSFPVYMKREQRRGREWSVLIWMRRYILTSQKRME